MKPNQCSHTKYLTPPKTQGTLTTSPGPHDPRTLGLLVFTAWFLVVLQTEETAASIAAVS
jgi:hypothetical protein